MEFLFALFGIAVGVITGLVPGLGILASLFIVFPLLMNANAMSLILFYVMLASTVQYVGSIVAISLGVPGENSSMYASKFGRAIANENSDRGASLISATATASLIGAVIGILLVAVGISNVPPQVMSIKVQAVILIIVAIIFIRYPENSKMVNILLIASGLFLGMLGMQVSDRFSIYFGQPWLAAGVNPMIVITMLFIIPNMVQNLNKKPIVDNNQDESNHKIGFLVGLNEIKFRIASVLRGSAIGSVLGLMPGGGATVSSSLAFSTEQSLNKSMISRLVSCEAANNAAAVTSILPVLIYGLPVLASEALIVDLISAQGILINRDWTKDLFYSVLTNLDIVLLTLILGNVFVWWMSVYMVNKIIFLYQKLSLSFVFMCTIIILCASIVVDTVKYQTYTVDIVTVVALLIPALFIVRKKIDTMPLVFAFMLSGVLISFMATAITFLN